MDELKKEQAEEVMEQRPSTKYGRTAYQEQLRKEQEALGNGVNDFGQSAPNEEQSWQRQSQNYAAYEVPKPVINNTFSRILMVLIAITAIINCVASVMCFDVFAQLQTIDAMEVMDELAKSREFAMISYAGDFVFWTTIVVFVLDLMVLYRAEYKITGAILFAILLRPVYFIWRAHLLGQKKLAAILYAVGYYGFCALELVVLFGKAFELVAMLGY